MVMHLCIYVCHMCVCVCVCVINGRYSYETKCWILDCTHLGFLLGSAFLLDFAFIRVSLYVWRLAAANNTIFAPLRLIHSGVHTVIL